MNSPENEKHFKEMGCWFITTFKNRNKNRGLPLAGLFWILKLFKYKNLSKKIETIIKNSSFNETQDIFSEIEKIFNEKNNIPSIFLKKSNISFNNSNDIQNFYDKDTLAALLDIFSEEAKEHLTKLNELLKIEVLNSQQMNEAYRVAHTLKGAAATVGLQNISSIGKMIEKYLFSHYENKTCFTNWSRINLFGILILLENTIDGDEKSNETHNLIEHCINLDEENKIIQDKEDLSFLSDEKILTPPIIDDESYFLEQMETIEKSNSQKNNKFEMDADLFELLFEVFADESEEHLNNLDLLLENLLDGKDVIHDLFRITHTLKGAAATVGLDYIAKAANSLEDYFEEFEKKKEFPEKNEIAFIFHGISLLRDSVEKKQDLHKELIETLEKAKKTRESPGKTSSKRKRKITGAHSIEVGAGDEKIINDPASRFLRLSINDINRLIGNSEELVLSRTQFEKSRDQFHSIINDLILSHQTFRNFILEDREKMSEVEKQERLGEIEVEIAELVNNLKHSAVNLTNECKFLQKISFNIKDNLLKMRVTSLDVLFLKLKQAVRDISFRTEKEIEIIFIGDKVEVDKGIIDNLSTPLLQIVRNAIVHGIEPFEKRIQAGKDTKGVLTVNTKQEGNFVLIELSDDGYGLNIESIKECILAKGFITSAEQLAEFSDEELLEAIFLPGFTTKKQADKLAGRGVGLDLVRNKVRKLGGEISVTTKKNKGTTFHIKVPITTFISKALLANIGREVYGIPASYVVEVFEYTSSKPFSPGMRILWNGESIPIVPLFHYFGINKNANFPINIIILEQGGKHFGITCDNVIGIRDVTVKPIGKLLNSLQYFFGAIISGAGTVQMMFNVSYLAALARPVLGFKVIKKRSSMAKTPKILVCDDSKSVREAAARVLTNAGYVIVMAQDGWEAWNLLHSENFDLVLTDLEMPRMNGYELITEMKRDTLLQDIPVVVLSSRTGELSRTRVNQAGADIFVTKPIKPLILLKVLEEIIPINDDAIARKILLFATTNNGKIRELNNLISDFSIDIWGMERFHDLPEVIEDKDTFEGNAIKKALERAKQTGLATLTDDSGLEVQALNGEPGVFSARYGGVNADDKERVEFLLKNMEGIKNRKASFISVLAFCPDPSEDDVIIVKGVVDGYITKSPRGENGFGYDPIFQLSNGKTLAELTLDEKSKISHRAKAFKLIVPELKKFCE
jgi:non-canonical purine NTP pyrophosphatase (RdgB/HAM1 family)